METYIIWLTKLILAHLLTDFVLQPRSWIKSRNQKHFSSLYLYVHGLVTAAVAWILIGVQYWKVGIIIFITHTLIDGWKSHQPDKIKYFFIDQLLHMLVIIGCWYFSFLKPEDLQHAWALINTTHYWILLTAFVFLTKPSGILIGKLTGKWRSQLPNAENLASAGIWIGMMERIVILILVLQLQYAAIGLFIAAKSILRFSDAERTEIKTEYLVIGTLISISLAILTGVLLLKFLH